MDDMIYRNDPIAEENIDPHGRPATDEFEEWSEEVYERTDHGLHGFSQISLLYLISELPICENPCNL